MPFYFRCYILSNYRIHDAFQSGVVHSSETLNCELLKALCSVMVLSSIPALSSMLNTLVPQFLNVISEDSDREVVMATVDVMHDLLEKIGQPVLLVPDATDLILTKMKLIFVHKV